jgi:catechol 2,3-dioxygenase-like lactoylglutathione lyase family enzyme
MLKDSDTYSTIPVSDRARAKAFYSETLGFSVDRDTEGGVMYRSGSTRFFVYPSSYKAGGHTQMSWFVKDIKAEVARLKAKGIQFEHYDVPGLTMVDGIAQSGPGVQTAWFKDPDGNLLGLTQIDD